MRQEEFLTFSELALEYSENVWKCFKVKKGIMNRLYHIFDDERRIFFSL